MLARLARLIIRALLPLACCFVVAPASAVITPNSQAQCAAIAAQKEPGQPFYLGPDPYEPNRPNIGCWVVSRVYGWYYQVASYGFCPTGSTPQNTGNGPNGNSWECVCNNSTDVFDGALCSPPPDPTPPSCPQETFKGNATLASLTLPICSNGCELIQSTDGVCARNSTTGLYYCEQRTFTSTGQQCSDSSSSSSASSSSASSSSSSSSASSSSGSSSSASSSSNSSSSNSSTGDGTGDNPGDGTGNQGDGDGEGTDPDSDQSGPGGVGGGDGDGEGEDEGGDCSTPDCIGSSGWPDFSGEKLQDKVVQLPSSLTPYQIPGDSGGSCPPSVQLRLVNYSLTFDKPCDLFRWLKPAILALCALVSIYIVMGKEI